MKGCVCSGQFRCSNLGTELEPGPSVKLVLFLTAADETLGPDMNLINSAELESCLSHHNGLEVASLAHWDNYNVAEPELRGQLEVVMQKKKKLGNNNFWSLKSALKRVKKYVFLSQSVSQTGQAGCQKDRQLANFPDIKQSAGARLANRQPVKSQILEFFTCQFRFLWVSSPHHLKKSVRRWWQISWRCRECSAVRIKIRHQSVSLHITEIWSFLIKLWGQSR